MLTPRPAPPHAGDGALFARYAGGDLAAREALLLRHMPMARRIARRYRPEWESREDLEQLAFLGLLKAIDRFQPRTGSHFEAYAVAAIRGELRHHVRANGRSQRATLSIESSAPAEDDASRTLAETVGEADRALASAELRVSLEPHVGALPERERQVVGLRFVDDLHQSEIGDRLGISQMHVSRLLRRSLDTLLVGLRPAAAPGLG